MGNEGILMPITAAAHTHTHRHTQPPSENCHYEMYRLYVIPSTDINSGDLKLDLHRRSRMRVNWNDRWCYVYISVQCLRNRTSARKERAVFMFIFSELSRCRWLLYNYNLIIVLRARFYWSAAVAFGHFQWQLFVPAPTKIDASKSNIPSSLCTRAP